VRFMPLRDISTGRSPEKDRAGLPIE